MDAMVTGRMPTAKKELGNRVLRELGTTASQAINDLYDYAITHHALPFPSAEGDRQERLRAAVKAVDAVPKVELKGRFLSMDLRQARGERLLGRGLLEEPR